MFIEKYIGSVNSSDLRDDEHHHATEPLHASASADKSGGAIFGSLLARAKYSDGTTRKTFEAGTKNLAELLRVWEAAVVERGTLRAWLPIKHHWDIHAAHCLYKKIARVSLAHWLDGLCGACNGARVTRDRRGCLACGGTGQAQIEGGTLEIECVKTMVSELEGIYQAHGGRAAGLLRRAA